MIVNSLLDGFRLDKSVVRSFTLNGAADGSFGGQPAQKDAPAGGMLDALTHAQQRARKRTERR
jgi:hypothetical protein